MMSPKISIIVAVYKAEAYLHRCVDSLLVQTFQDFEILLIDDGSPDNSGKMMAVRIIRERSVMTMRSKMLGSVFFIKKMEESVLLGNAEWSM